MRPCRWLVVCSTVLLPACADFDAGAPIDDAIWVDDDGRAAAVWSAPLTAEHEISAVPGLRAGDLYTDGKIALEVPEVGFVNSAFLDFAGGGAISLEVANPDGRGVTVERRLIPAPEPLEPEDSAVDPEDDRDDASAGELDSALRWGSPSACSDGYYEIIEGATWATAYTYSFHSSSMPSRYQATDVEATIGRAVAHMTASYNDCGLADEVSATSTYAGTTTVAPNVGYSDGKATCTTRDSYNVVGFGALPAGILAVTCNSRYTSGRTIHSDIRISNTVVFFLTARAPFFCLTKQSLEGTMTHEFGHTFGLKDIAEASHGKLTMSAAQRACDASGATLGKGDVLGLRALY